MKHFWNQKEFFQDHWQRKPWHGKNQLVVDPIAIDPKDFDFLCNQSEVTTRMLVNHDNSFALERAKWDPMDQRPRTLFIQEMDRWFVEVRELFNHFPIYPRWRMDDIMGSYSTQGASSSPHVDFYDVFIVQVSGSKLWKVEKEKRSFEDCKNEALIEHPDLKIIKELREVDEYLLEPGDVLYVPTRFVHEAIAQTDSYSYSMGLRSPRVRDMVHFMNPKVAKSIDEDLRMEETFIYQNPFEIPNSILHEVLNWPSEISLPEGPTPLWFGKLATSNGTQTAYLKDILQEDQNELLTTLQNPDVLWELDPLCSMAWQKTSSGPWHLFIQGDYLEMPPSALEFVETLWTTQALLSKEMMAYAQKDPWILPFITYLYVNDWISSEIL